MASTASRLDLAWGSPEGANRAPRFPTIVILPEAFNVPAGRLFDRIP
jgi:hypothetical protein